MDPTSRFDPQNPESLARARELVLLQNLVQPDPKFQGPILDTDSVLELSSLDLDEDDVPQLRKRLETYFGCVLDISLRMPAWKYIDILKTHVPGWPDDNPWRPRSDAV